MCVCLCACVFVCGGGWVYLWCVLPMCHGSPVKVRGWNLRIGSLYTPFMPWASNSGKQTYWQVSLTLRYLSDSIYNFYNMISHTDNKSTKNILKVLLNKVFDNPNEDTVLHLFYYGFVYLSINTNLILTLKTIPMRLKDRKLIHLSRHH